MGVEQCSTTYLERRFLPLLHPQGCAARIGMGSVRCRAAGVIRRLISHRNAAISRAIAAMMAGRFLLAR